MRRTTLVLFGLCLVAMLGLPHTSAVQPGRLPGDTATTALPDGGARGGTPAPGSANTASGAWAPQLNTTGSANTASSATAQTDPLTLPLAQPSDFSTTASTWTYPTDDGRNLGTASSLAWNGGIVGLSLGGRLYVRCHEHSSGVAEIQPPDNWAGVATVTERCSTPARLDSIDPGQGNGVRIGGAIAWGGRTIIAAHVYYGGTTAKGSHFVGTSHLAMTSPVNALVSPTPGVTPAMFSSNAGMTPVPAIWRGLLGGPVLVGGCCQAVVSRTSYGPSVHVFDPDRLPLAGGGSVPARTLIAFPDAHRTLGEWNGPDVNGYNMNSMSALSFIVPGSRTLAIVGGRGSTYCYGVGTKDPALAGKPDGTGTLYCFDPTDSNRGGHGYPYTPAVWLWDLKAVLSADNPWDVKPYFYGNIPAFAGLGRVIGGAFLESSSTLLVTDGAGDKPMVVHVLTVKVGNAPTPVDCEGEWAEVLSEPTPLVCDATEQQTRTRTRVFTMTRAPEHNGAACPESPVVTTETTDCKYEPPHPPTPKVVSAIRAH
jgi:hypothetical protein